MADTAQARPGGRTARTRAAVLDATVAELAEHGHAALTVEAVAARAGVNKTTLYRRWGGKDGLLADAVGPGYSHGRAGRRARPAPGRDRRPRGDQARRRPPVLPAAGARRAAHDRGGRPGRGRHPGRGQGRGVRPLGGPPGAFGGGAAGGAEGGGDLAGLLL